MENKINPTKTQSGPGIAIKVAIVLILACSVGLAFYLRAMNKPSDDSVDTLAPAGESGLPRLVDLGSDECIPCKTMAPMLNELRKEYKGKMEVVFIDVWKNPKAKKQYGIDLIPTQIFFNAAGDEVFRHVGSYSKEEILNKWRELGVNLDEQQPEQSIEDPSTTREN